MRAENTNTGGAVEWIFSFPSFPHRFWNTANAVDARGAMTDALRGELRVNELMSRHVSWRAAGKVERAYLPADLDDLRVPALALRTNRCISSVSAATPSA